MKLLARRAIGLAVVALVAGLLLATAIGWLEAALYVALSRLIAPPFALLATAGAALLALALFIVLARLWLGGKRRTPPAGMDDALESRLCEVLGLALGKRTVEKMRARGLEGTLMALLAGGLVGASPRLRRLLRAFLDL